MHSRGDLGAAYNQINVTLCTTWDPNGITFANSSTVGMTPWGLFVDTNNSVYVNARALDSILIWGPGNMNMPRSIATPLSKQKSVIVTTNGDIYADASDNNVIISQVFKWTVNATRWVTVMSLPGGCSGLFVDVYDSIYCSIETHHQVIRRLITDDVNTTSVVAGSDNGTSGLTMGMLSSPRGIFVTRALRLYVADCGNNRVQSFQPGRRTASTVMGHGDVSLNCPTGVALDGNGYLFVTDSGNNRVIGSGLYGYRCVIGCSGTSGQGSNQLNTPYGLSFDSNGNIYVADGNNHRIQQFILASNSCGKLRTVLFDTEYRLYSERKPVRYKNKDVSLK